MELARLSRGQGVRFPDGRVRAPAVGALVVGLLPWLPGRAVRGGSWGPAARLLEMGRRPGGAAPPRSHSWRPAEQDSGPGARI